MRYSARETTARALGCWGGAILLVMLAGCRSALHMPEEAPLPTAVDRTPVEVVEVALPVIAYTIQVGAFSTVERASAYADRLASYGLDTYYFIDTDGLCKVRFDRFATKALARQRAQALRQMGLIDEFYVVQPRPTGPQPDERERLQESLVQTARRFIGTPYRWGGSSARRGFDCSGLTMTVYRLNGLELPRNSRSQFGTGRPVARDALEKGDLVFFATGKHDRVTHVGIYSGEGRFIHAPGTGKTIRTASLSTRYFQDRYAGARRYLQVN